MDLRYKMDLGIDCVAAAPGTAFTSRHVEWEGESSRPSAQEGVSRNAGLSLKMPARDRFRNLDHSSAKWPWTLSRTVKTSSVMIVTERSEVS